MCNDDDYKLSGHFSGQQGIANDQDEKVGVPNGHRTQHGVSQACLVYYVSCMDAFQGLGSLTAASEPPAAFFHCSGKAL